MGKWGVRWWNTEQKGCTGLCKEVERRTVRNFDTDSVALLSLLSIKFRKRIKDSAAAVVLMIKYQYGQAQMHKGQCSSHIINYGNSYHELPHLEPHLLVVCFLLKRVTD